MSTTITGRSGVRRVVYNTTQAVSWLLRQTVRTVDAGRTGGRDDESDAGEGHDPGGSLSGSHAECRLLVDGPGAVA